MDAVDAEEATREHGEEGKTEAAVPLHTPGGDANELSSEENPVPMATVVSKDIPKEDANNT